jgi:hypothetical protein
VRWISVLIGQPCAPLLSGYMLDVAYGRSLLGAGVID